MKGLKNPLQTTECFMTIDREGFRQTLKKKTGADDGVIETVMAKAEPFFICADAGLYRFAPAEEVRKTEVANAVRTAFGSPVRRVELVSVSNPWDDWPPYFNEGVIKTSLNVFLKNGVMQVTPHMMADTHYGVLRETLGPMAVTAYQLEELIKDATQKALWKSLKKSMEGGIWPDDLWRELYRCIYCTLTCYIGYLLAGLPEMAQRIEPMIDLLPSTIPLGAMRFSRSAQISFVA